MGNLAASEGFRDSLFADTRRNWQVVEFSCAFDSVDHSPGLA